MKQVIKYFSVGFALILAASIIGGCLTAGVEIVKAITENAEWQWGNNGNGIWYREENGDVVFLGIRFGGNTEVKSGSEIYPASDIRAMRLEVSAGELLVEVWESEDISVVYENIPETYEIQNRQGVLEIERKEDIFIWNSMIEKTPKIKICVPATMKFEEIAVDSGSGSVKLSDVSTEKFHVDTGSGPVTVENSYLGEASADTGSGIVNFEQITAEHMVVDSGSGRVNVAGYLSGNCVFDTGSGSVNVEIYGEAEEYDIRADVGSGSLYLNGDKVKDTTIKHEDAENLLVFDTGSGRVSVEFKKAPDEGTGH